MGPNPDEYPYAGYYPSDEELAAYETPMEPPRPASDYGGYPYPQVPVVSGYGDRLALALQGLPPLPTTRAANATGPAWLAHLVSGAARGFSGARVQQMSERERLNKALAQKAHDENMANLAATRAARTAGTVTGTTAAQFGLPLSAVGKQISELTPEQQRLVKQEKPGEVAKTIPLTETLLAQHPEFRRVPLGTNIPVDWFKPQEPETPKERRAADAAARQAHAAEITSVGKLADQYENDPDVKGFPTIRDSYETGLDASKRGNSAGDIVLMRMIAKTTDPTTGVREEEFRTFEGAQGTLAKFGVTLTRKMWGAGTLNDPGRRELTSILQGIYDRKLDRYGSAYDFHSSRITDLGEKPGRIIRDYRLTKARPKSSAGATVRMRAPDGQGGFRIWDVPSDKVTQAKARGAVEVQ